jgi:hypothetical protein|uniref:Uncharacterized protein n=1 Tax=Mus musculus TaxID=10090 RepID=Q3TN74_MOUSE|nr:unnamed protein product [Mus musculus]
MRMVSLRCPWHHLVELHLWTPVAFRENKLSYLVRTAPLS